MELEQKLLAVPIEQWSVRQVIAFGWYDGPLSGICALAHPAVEFFFDLVDERHNPDGLDYRLFRLSDLPPGSATRAQAAMRELGKPATPVWAPTWKFPNEAVQSKAQQEIAQIEASKKMTSLIIHTQDWEHFLGCWTVDANLTNIRDWFAFLNIPPAEPTYADRD